MLEIVEIEMMEVMEVMMAGTELELFLAGLMYFARKELNLMTWTEQLELPVEQMLLLYFCCLMQFGRY